MRTIFALVLLLLITFAMGVQMPKPMEEEITLERRRNRAAKMAKGFKSMTARGVRKMRWASRQLWAYLKKHN